MVIILDIIKRYETITRSRLIVNLLHAGACSSTTTQILSYCSESVARSPTYMPPSERRIRITSSRASALALNSLKDDFTFLWEHVIFRYLLNKTP
jgi:hypothetical protein